MPIDLLTLGAALLTGLMGSIHCVVMCGAIATSLNGVTASREKPLPALGAASVLNLGRVLGYVVAGAVAGAIGGGLVDLFAWQRLLRVALGIVMMLIALRMLGIGDRWNFLNRIGVDFSRWLAPLRRRLLPATTWPRRLALGALWGWLPCGLSSSVLLVAWLEADAVRGALVMAAFGLGTLPAMIPLTWSGTRAAMFLNTRGGRKAAAAAIFVAGVLTAAAPWLMQIPALHGVLDALGCRSIP